VIRVWAQFGDWPPVGEVVLLMGKQSTRLTPDNAEIIGNALLGFATSAREMTQMVEEHPGMAEGVFITNGGAHC
jgi:hypothetical protein